MAKEKKEGLLPSIKKHLVAVSMLDIPNNIDEGDSSLYLQPSNIIFSTFIVCVNDIWFLITAGHILKYIEDRIQSGRKIIRSRLVDSFRDSQNINSIPFDFVEAPQIHIYSDEDGIDYGAIMLRNFYIRSLFADGSRAINEKENESPPDKADKYFLLGFPTQARKIESTLNENGGKIIQDFGCILTPIQPVYKPPIELQKKEKRFYAKVRIIKGNPYAKDGIMTDIDGMSGGPIIAVKKVDSKTIRYWVIAVQSGWLKSKRILAACYMKPFIKALQGGIKKLKEQSQTQ